MGTNAVVSVLFCYFGLSYCNVFDSYHGDQAFLSYNRHKPRTFRDLMKADSTETLQIAVPSYLKPLSSIEYSDDHSVEKREYTTKDYASLEAFIEKQLPAYLTTKSDKHLVRENYRDINYYEKRHTKEPYQQKESKLVVKTLKPISNKNIDRNFEDEDFKSSDDYVEKENIRTYPNDGEQSQEEQPADVTHHHQQQPSSVEIQTNTHSDEIKRQNDAQHYSDHGKKHKEVHYHKHKHMHEHEHKQQHVHKHQAKHEHKQQHEHKHKHVHKQEHKHEHGHEHKNEHQHEHKNEHHHQHKAHHEHHHKNKHAHGHKHAHKHDHKQDHHHDHKHDQVHSHDHHASHGHHHGHDHKHDGHHEHDHHNEHKHEAKHGHKHGHKHHHEEKEEHEHKSHKH
ncbi:unnamed protein product [Brassicogethes aeneus]|uniref:Histidine-rich glycoprotein-like n=1 Tax=Brassicogethes aeneus TaxID=1431903 RepID=A0A9P0BHS7_BRAAE|nr:unnamed protein product [Brassicogethes aeneus]